MSGVNIFNIGKLTLPSIKKESANYFSSCKTIKELKPSDFDPFCTYSLRSSEYTFIMFYAPWCGYCQRAKDLWVEFSKKISKVPITVAAFNCEKYKDCLILMNEDALRKQGHKIVPSYPTLILYKKGKPLKTFTNERTMKNLISFLKVNV